MATTVASHYVPAIKLAYHSETLNSKLKFGSSKKSKESHLAQKSSFTKNRLALQKRTQGKGEKSTQYSFPAVCASVNMTVNATESATGIKFPLTITPPGASSELSLLGVGVREKKIAILSVKVYAAALYYNATSISSSFATYKGKDISQDESFFTALSNDPAAKSIVIVLARDVEGKQFWEALDDALKPRMKAVVAGAAGDAALATFGDAFKTRSLKKNNGIILTWTQPSTLQIAVADDAAELTTVKSTVATIDSQPLLAALYDVYLGKESVSPTLKASVAEGIQGFL